MMTSVMCPSGRVAGQAAHHHDIDEVGLGLPAARPLGAVDSQPQRGDVG
jgi:hypothetical protein